MSEENSPKNGSKVLVLLGVTAFVIVTPIILILFGSLVLRFEIIVVVAIAFIIVIGIVCKLLLGGKPPKPINEAYREIVETHDYTTQPEFIYQPNAYRDGTFEHKTAKCDCCEREVEWIAEYGIYVPGREDSCICPWCFCSGAATLKYGETLNEFDQSGEQLPQEVIDAVRLRTPSLHECWQPVEWQGCCSDAMRYLETVKSKAQLEKYRSAEFQTALDKFKSFNNFNKMGDTLDKGRGGLQILVFQCRHCGKYGLALDAD